MAAHPPTPAAPYVLPSREDPVARSALPLLGGPVGRRAALGRSWWTPVRVSIVAALAAFAVGWLSKSYCVTNGWAAPQRYMYLCYSDIPPLYESRGLAAGVFPYVFEPGQGQRMLEYPVLTGVYMYLAALVTRALDGSGTTFFAVNVAGFAALLAWTVAATSRTVARRPWDGMLVALAPAVALAGFINWDLLAIALTSASLLAWSRSRPLLAGVLLGLAAAAKFYPLLLLGPIVMLCVRRRQWRSMGVLLIGSVGAWLAVNVPVMVANFDGWAEFYRFSQDRGMDFGSPWYALSLMGWTVPAGTVNMAGLAAFLALCAGIGALALWAPRPPRVAALALLTVAAFGLTNKVYSPQYVLWVLPLAALARPRWRDLLIWQAAEAAYFVAIWWYLVGYGTQDPGLPAGGYVLATAAHWLATAWLMGLVVRDVLRPEHDPVRTDGFAEDREDPGGGVLDAPCDARGSASASVATPGSRQD